MKKYIIITALFVHAGTAILATKAEQPLESSVHSGMEVRTRLVIDELHYPNRPGKREWVRKREWWCAHK